MNRPDKKTPHELMNDFDFILKLIILKLSIYLAVCKNSVFKIVTSSVFFKIVETMKSISFWCSPIIFLSLCIVMNKFDFHSFRIFVHFSCSNFKTLHCTITEIIKKLWYFWINLLITLMVTRVIIGINAYPFRYCTIPTASLGRVSGRYRVDRIFRVGISKWRLSYTV